MSTFVKAGTRVRIGTIGSRSNGAAERKAAGDEGQTGKIMEEGRIGPDAGWDVYDVMLDSGRETFAHGFELTKAKSGKTSRFASEREYWYTIIVVDHVGRQIGQDQLEQPMTRKKAYDKLIAILRTEAYKTDPVIYGGYLSRDGRN